MRQASIIHNHHGVRKGRRARCSPCKQQVNSLRLLRQRGGCIQHRLHPEEGIGGLEAFQGLTVEAQDLPAFAHTQLIRGAVLAHAFDGHGHGPCEVHAERRLARAEDHLLGLVGQGVSETQDEAAVALGDLCCLLSSPRIASASVAVTVLARPVGVDAIGVLAGLVDATSAALPCLVPVRRLRGHRSVKLQARRSLRSVCSWMAEFILVLGVGAATFLTTARLCSPHAPACLWARA
mmetsp:Transcript_24902/g.68383  ORF Transcript_24902/g.68383 Transcript_24902/m.68383 type:complete len:236 (+) Transcript_24902:273-980(+)